MGYGDFKLLSMIGAWLGWEVLPMGSAHCVLVWFIGWFHTSSRRLSTYHQPIPFGPFLALGGVLMLYGLMIYAILTLLIYNLKR